MAFGSSQIADPSLAPEGEQRLLWVEQHAGALHRVWHDHFSSRPLLGMRVAIRIAIEPKTAYLAILLQRAGAEVGVTSASVMDDVAAALDRRGIAVRAHHGIGPEALLEAKRWLLRARPQIMLDARAEMVELLHTEFAAQAGDMIGATEETTSGVLRLEPLAARGALRLPVLAANDARCKQLFDNRYGTGQSTVTAIADNTQLNLAGAPVAVLGFGWCGRGIARAAAAFGARVVVVEPDPVKALEASCEGYRPLDLEPALRGAGVVITATGAAGVIGAAHFGWLRDGAVLANAGAFEDEIDVPALRRAAAAEAASSPTLTTFRFADGRRVDLVAHGDQVNLAAAEGHPVEIMDLTFAVVLRAVAWLVEGRGRIPPGLHRLPPELDLEVARAKLSALGLAIDEPAS
ncbi:MAG TPA: adenosylhomocysteinase [Acidobacteriota bacterium]